VLSRFSHWILTKLGWTIQFEFPEVNKYVAIAAPHTSNWDFPLGILAAKAVNLKVTWLGKHSIFRWPFGWFFRAIGGTPIRRDSQQNYMQHLTDLFDHSTHLVLALAPEGTRSKTDHWKTGFHSVARAAGVPILMGYLDHGNKQVGMGGMFYPSDDIEADFKLIREFYKNRRGKNPEKESLIKVRKKTN
jgi:1-acyl-sn-glycerol-3-phosphate acyltransferase